MSQIGFFEQRNEDPRNLTIDNFIEDMMRMDDDPLARSGTNVVIYRGNPNAKLMIVGEAPGPQENIQGKPFVGKAGKLLDQILTAVELDPEKDVFITNSVFRMPPGDGGKAFRKPSIAEIEYYKPYVLELIRLTEPSIILLAGNVACQSILGKSGITKLRGHWVEIQNRWVMPIFHPSYLLRNPSREPGSPKSQMWDDIREVRKKYNQVSAR